MKSIRQNKFQNSKGNKQVEFYIQREKKQEKTGEVRE